MREGQGTPVLRRDGVRLMVAAGAALSWPSGEFERLAGPVHLSHLWILLAFAVVAREQVRTRRLTLPFDLAASAVGALAVALVFGAGAAKSGIALFAAFYAAASLGLSPAQTRTVLGAAAWCALAVAVAALAAQFLPVLPTASSLSGGIRMLGPVSLSAGGLVFVVGMAILLIRLPSGGLFNGAFCLAGMALFASVIIFMCRLLFMESVLWLPPSGLFMPRALPVTAAVLWLVSLCVGKLLTSARLDGGRVPALLAAGVFLVAFAVLVLRAPVPPGAAFLLGLAVSAGYPRPAATRADRRFLLFPAVLAVLLALAHVFWLEHFPGDTRHYAARARASMEEGRPEEADRLLRLVLSRKPREARAVFWRGNAALAAGRPGEAVDRWQQASALAGGRGVLPAPTAAEWEEAQARLRDHVGTLPEASRGWALERFLLVRGERAAALGLLRVRVEEAPDQNGSSELYARALAALLGFPELGEELARWRAGELVQALSLGHPYGAVVTAPAGFPAAWTPLVAAVRTTQGGAAVQVWTDRAAFGGDRRGGCGAGTDAVLWMSPKTDAEGGWHLSAPPVGRVLLEGEGRVFFEDYDAGWGCDESDGWQVICVVP